MREKAGGKKARHKPGLFQILSRTEGMENHAVLIL
jgi:hypothetical protein